MHSKSRAQVCAMSTQTLVSERILGEMADSKARAGKVWDEFEHPIVPWSKEALKNYGT